jgi:uncharacterized protein YdeI (YjbR/CyaY-like superfamily)
MNPNVDKLLAKPFKWQAEFEKLRSVILGCGLTEELKWGQPCYTFQNNNVVLIHGFKEYCALLFFKGALLSDPEGILIRQTQNVQSSRQVRFTSLHEIEALENVLRTYVYEAVEVEKAGLKVTFKKSTEYPVPEELQQKFDDIPALKTAFYALTPGRQRAYLLYFSQAKHAKTREARIDRYLQHILNGKGMDDL